MAFFQRIMNYLLNEVLVNSLANSKTFQKFAIRSNAVLGEAAKKGVQHHANVTEKGSEFFKVFRQEMTKGLRDIQGGSKGPGQGFS